jgi:hypothetical protein
MRPERSILRLVFALSLAGIAAGSARAQTVFFEDATSSAYESVGYGAAIVRLSSPAGLPVTVTVSFLDLNAEKGKHYLAADGPLTIPAGRTSALAAFTLVNDKLVQPQRRFQIALSNPVNATLGVQVQHTFTIVEDDKLPKEPEKNPPEQDPDPNAPPDPPEPPPPADPPVVVSFVVPESNPDEDVDEHPVQIVLSASTNVPVQVPVSLVHLTTTAADAGLAQTSVTIPAGASQGEVMLNVTDDDRCEFPETLRLALGEPSVGTRGTVAEHTVRIRDNDFAQVGLDPSTSAREEADESLRIHLRLSQPAPYTVAADVAISGDAEPDGVDYRLVAGQASHLSSQEVPPPPDPDGDEEDSGPPADPSVTISDTTRPVLARRVFFAPGTTEMPLDFGLLDDDLVEDNEEIQVRITQAWNAVIAPASNLFVHTIEDNDLPQPNLSFVESALLLGEGDSGSIRVALDAEHNLPVRFSLTLSGTATPNQDFRLLTGPFTIPAGELEKEIPLEGVEDALLEPDETVTVRLVDPENARIGPTNRFQVTLFDNDAEVNEDRLVAVKIPANELNRTLHVLGARSPAVIPRGLAVDRAGNRYLTEYGNGLPERGAIWMIPAGDNRILRLVDKLTQPGDIELSPDHRALIFSEPGGKITKLRLGLSIKLTNLDPFGVDTQVTIKGPVGSRTARASEDGWFHFLDLLPDYPGFDEVDVVIQSGGVTRTHVLVPLGRREPGHRPYGQTLLQLEF